MAYMPFQKVLHIIHLNINLTKIIDLYGFIFLLNCVDILSILMVE